MPRATNGVKKEKVVKEEKNKGKQRQQPEDEEDPQNEETSAQDAEEQEESGSPRGSKRLRVNDQGDSAPSPSGSQPLPKYQTLPRDTDGYIPGSIVRIQLKNFVTYDYVQFRPGPYLNMILGPNGTGKSSIACAIALGLNFPPQVLGRATELPSFVKNGTDSGYIEIELKAPAGKANYTIRRTLSATSKSSSFTLNGKSATGHEIKARMAELNVQVGNLCSFLPQDKVSEFAGMSPQQLLRETQRAAGDENLTRWHDTLISAGKDLRNVAQNIKDEENLLQQMKERNDGIEKDVKRYKERKNIEHQIALLDVLIPVAQYREIREQYVAKKNIQRKLHERVQKLKERNAPAHELKKKYDAMAKNADDERNQLVTSTKEKFRQLQNAHGASDKLESAADKILTDLNELKKDEKNRIRNIKILENEIEKLQEAIDKPPPNLPSMEDLAERRKQLNLERQGLASEKDAVDAEISQNIEQRSFHNIKAEQAEKALAQLDNFDTRKLQAMQSWDPDTYDAIVWVRNNRNLFKMEVFETPYMRMSVKDPRFTDAVETLAGGALKQFVCQCQEDSDTLNHYINDTQQGLGRKARISVWFRSYTEQNDIPPPMTREEMKELGFDGYALDYLIYPPGMEWFLKNFQLHRSAIALDPRGVNVNRAMEYVGRPGPGHSGGATFVVGKTVNTVSRSRYGKKALSNVTRSVYEARNLKVPPIDPEKVKQLQDAINESRREVEMLDEARVPLKKQLEEIQSRDKKFQIRADEIKHIVNKITQESTRISRTKAQLDSKRQNLERLHAQPPVEERRAELKKNLMKTTDRRLKIAQEYVDLIQNIVSEQNECTKIGLKHLQIGANKAALDALCKRKDEKYNAALEEFNKVHEEFTTIKQQSKQILEESRIALAEATEQVQTEFRAIEDRRLAWEKECTEAKQAGRPLPDKTGVDLRNVEELKAEIEVQKAQLEMNLITNPGIVEQYEKRLRDIESLQKTLDDKRKRRDKIERDIKQARDHWQPSLEKLVNSIGKKFSAAFDRIGCAGEIRISENEDYEKWAIDILVKFRDSEKLQLLTAHRQSGGERSLTTILYLMSLTEEARAPFSLVDEINQGMDQRAERVVHNSMVGVTCKEDSAQYFLITPKLLPDLEYHERMKILCVNNGEWLPEQKNIGCMNDMISVYLAHKRGNAASSA
ncbi:hypothetical protein CVT24_000055 [Panaeolus cyanescens]|uniref:Structural maintenance of chromosomes protein 5 n=1 Tax=Panaeolus cyanescens TaxID=181874 RepID=A0A409VWF2_9AGAR|nr:hypothetical protein CVT24_000055 [Panaeolus cyanescens]